MGRRKTRGAGRPGFEDCFLFRGKSEFLIALSRLYIISTVFIAVLWLAIEFIVRSNYPLIGMLPDGSLDSVFITRIAAVFGSVFLVLLLVLADSILVLISLCLIRAAGIVSARLSPENHLLDIFWDIPFDSRHRCSSLIPRAPPSAYL